MAIVSKATLVGEIENAYNDLKEHLVGAHPALEIALARAVYDIYNDEWTHHASQIVSHYGGQQLSAKQSLQSWHNQIVTKAKQIVQWEQQSKAADAAWKNQVNSNTKILDMLANPKSFPKFYAVYSPLARPAPAPKFASTSQTSAYMDVFRSQFTTWYNSQRITPQLLAQSSEHVMTQFLAQHPETVALLKTCHEPDQKGGPVHEIAMYIVEMQLKLTPVLSQGFGLYSSWENRDILNYSKMTDTERGILGATVLIPANSRLLKTGRAMYTPKRLHNVFGGDIDAWTKAISYAAFLSSTGPQGKELLRILEAASDNMRNDGDRNLANNAIGVLYALTEDKVRGNIIPPPVQLEHDTFSLWNNAVASFRWIQDPIASLDEYSFRRTLLMGPNSNHLQSQLVAELAESYIGQLLRDRSGRYALGLAVPNESILKFIPGHAVRAPQDYQKGSNRQISDGVIGFWDRAVFKIAAILEIKVNGQGGRELGHRIESAAQLNRLQQAQLRAYCNREWIESQDVAEKLGVKFDKKIEDFGPDILVSEKGSQVVRDINRFDGLKQIQINGIQTSFQLIQDPERLATTKVFGVVPKGVDVTNLRAEVDQLNKGRKVPLTFEPLGLPVESGAVEQIGNFLYDGANRMVWCPGTVTDPDVCKPAASPEDYIKYIDMLYKLATAYKSADPKKLHPNVLVLQWLRHIDYDKDLSDSVRWNQVAGDVDDDWIKFVNLKNVTMTQFVHDPKHAIHMKVSHFGATANAVYIQGDTTGTMINRGDIAGWAGDFIAFYGEWVRDRTPPGRQYCSDRLMKPGVLTNFKMRDGVEDVDGYNVGRALLKNPKRTIVDEITDLYKTNGGYQTRFKRFFDMRFGGSKVTASDAANAALHDKTDGIIRAGRWSVEVLQSWRNLASDPPASQINELCNGFGDIMDEFASMW